MPPKLQEFLDSHSINVEALSRIKHRVFVVGRFNRREVSPVMPPDVYLFTNRPQSEFSDRYLEFFTKTLGLRFEEFIKALQPAVAEEVRAGRIPAVIQNMPSQEGSDEGSVVIDTWNFFFWRAIANTDQEAFKSGLSGIAREILREGEKDPGRGIYKLIRRNLNVLCRFQPRTAELVQAFSLLLESCAKLHGLPAYGSGGALPGGFLEKFVDFVYSPDLATDFSLDGLVLTGGVWDDLKSERSRQSLVKVVNTFRNVLIGAADQHGDMKAIDGTTIYQKALDILGKRKDLLKEFGQARDAYTALNQIVRSRVLLSMVLEWVFKAHYELDPVKAISADEEDDRDQMVEQLVLGKVRSSAVAEPVKRATSDERDNFRKSLSEGFEQLILAVVADDTKYEKILRELPAELQPVAEELRGSAERRELLKNMTMLTGDPRPFIKSQQSILIDVLLPILYQAPTVSLYDLRMMFRREVQTAYLTAITLDDKYQGIIRGIGEEFLPTFIKNIDDRTREIRNKESMRRDLLQQYIARIASPDLAQRIIDAQEEIRRAMTVIENTTIRPGETRGASNIMSIYSEEYGSTRKTPISDRARKAVGELASSLAAEAVKELPAEKVVETVAEKNTAVLSAAVGAEHTHASTASPASALDSDTATSGGDGPASTPHLDSSGPNIASMPVESAPDDGITLDIKGMLKEIAASGRTQQKNDFIASFRTQVETDQGVVRKAEDAVRGFHQVLRTVYQRYRENEEKERFVGSVERMTLANLMLNNQETLGLGKACSNLYAMLLDVVENMNSENPDPAKFIREYSLTRYFDNDVLEKDRDDRSGITLLRQTLRGQAHESLANTVNFISELRGIKYLMDNVGKDSRAEVIVVNATADEFRDWIVRDNLTNTAPPNAPDPRATLGSAFIQDPQQSTASPGLVYLTDSAFSGGGKKAWLESLDRETLVNGNLRLVIPPLCLSTGVQDEQQSWVADGKDLAASAKTVPAPVLIVGPSPYMNRKKDTFNTYLPAGYVFAAHFLRQPEQKLVNHRVGPTDQGRFRVIGVGIGTMRDTIERVLWGGARDETYSFAVDFYLYIILQILATAQNNARAVNKAPAASDYFQFFTGHRNPGVIKNRWESSSVINAALIGKSDDFGMEQDVSKQPLKEVTLHPLGSELRISEIEWFNQALIKANLPRFQ